MAFRRSTVRSRSAPPTLSLDRDHCGSQLRNVVFFYRRSGSETRVCITRQRSTTRRHIHLAQRRPQVEDVLSANGRHSRGQRSIGPREYRESKPGAQRSDARTTRRL